MSNITKFISLSFGGKACTFTINNNQQITRQVVDGKIIKEEQLDDMAKVLQGMERCNMGGKKPQPQVKDDDGNVVKLGYRYQTLEERQAGKKYTNEHSSAGQSKTSSLQANLDVIKNLDAVAASIKDEESKKKVLGYRATVVAQVLETIDSNTLTLLQALGVKL